jgi:hypothetical protein
VGAMMQDTRVSQWQFSRHFSGIVPTIKVPHFFDSELATTTDTMATKLIDNDDSDDDELLSFRAFAPKSTTPQPAYTEISASISGSIAAAADLNNAQLNAAPLSSAASIPTSVSPSQHDEDDESPKKMPARSKSQPINDDDPRELGRLTTTKLSLCVASSIHHSNSRFNSCSRTSTVIFHWLYACATYSYSIAALGK